MEKQAVEAPAINLQDEEITAEIEAARELW